MNKKKKIITILIAVVAFIILVLAIYFTWFFAYTCDDLACFQSHQERCSKTKFVNDESDTTWQYKIKGKKNDVCEIEVQVLKIKQGSLDKKILEDKSMTCLIPLGNLMMPESDISKCSGPLKEELQTMIIAKLHSYIIENVGEIGEELNKII